MPGLKAIADPLEGAAQSRAVSWHAAGVGIAGAMFFAAPACSTPWPGLPPPSCSAAAPRRCLRHRGHCDASALAREAGQRDACSISGRCFETDGRWLGSSATRSHLGTGRAARLGGHLPDRHRGRLGAPDWLPAPAGAVHAAGLGIAVSVTGNETAQRYGRSRVVLWAMTAAAALSMATGWTTGISHSGRRCVLAWNRDLPRQFGATAGTVQAADRHLRGATMGLHSMAGYAGGFLGPLGVGRGARSRRRRRVIGWGLAFGISPSSRSPALWSCGARCGSNGRHAAMTRPVHPHVCFIQGLPIGGTDARSGMSSGRASGALNR